MFVKALIAFLALPGIAAGIVPAILVAVDSGRVAGTAAGWPLIALGLGVLLRCVRDFYTSGNGTLAPWDPPQRLVITGLYRYVRNPMYIAIVVYLTGWAMAAGSPLLGGYAVASAIAFHLRVLVSEEPWLAAQFPTEWQQYQKHVPRWRPRITPWRTRNFTQ